VPPEVAQKKHLLLLRFSGDVSTKADGTKQRFTRRLARNVEDALAASGITYKLERDRFRLYLEVSNPAALDPLHRIFGIQSFSQVHRRECRSLSELVVAGEEIFRDLVREKRFAVRARRGGVVSKIPFRSLEVERELGRVLLSHAAKVDLSHPEVTAYVEVRPGEAYFFSEKLAGQGGLPVGAEGRALALVSGGYDSAVASWLLLKRGVCLDYLSCNLGGRIHREGVLKVMKVIAEQWSYGYRPRLYEVDFFPVVAELKEKTEPRYWQVLLKRQMLRAAARLASYLRVSGIVTGEAVGQVSSQTLQNLAVISQATDFPLLRPLLGFNKNEIIQTAREIGTYAYSAAVDEYCAILPRHPATQASLSAIKSQEAELDDGLIARVVDRRTVTDLRSAPLLPEGKAELEVETITPGAVVLDLRSRSAYRAWHAPGALHLDFFQALTTYRSFDPSQTYVLYCEVGLKSAHLAELLSEAGVRARHVKGGVRSLLGRGHESLDL
jgi:thiamine biosynthesis protein ThiI